MAMQSRAARWRTYFLTLFGSTYSHGPRVQLSRLPRFNRTIAAAAQDPDANQAKSYEPPSAIAPKRSGPKTAPAQIPVCDVPVVRAEACAFVDVTTS